MGHENQVSPISRDRARPAPLRAGSSGAARSDSQAAPASKAARRALAAAAGSEASVMARTTTILLAPAATTCSTLPRSIPPIANQGKRGLRFRWQRRRPPHTAPGQGRRRPGRVWWGWPTPVPRRSSRGRRRQSPRTTTGWRRRSVPWCGWKARSRRPRPGSVRAEATGRSFWPMWNTGAPDSDGDVRAVIDCPQPPVAGGGRLKDLSSSSSSAASMALSRSWMMSTPPANAASTNSAKSPRSLRASVHRYSLALWGRPPGSWTVVLGRMLGLEDTFMETSLVPLNWASTAGARCSRHKAAGLRGRQSRPLDLIRLVPA